MSLRNTSGRGPSANGTQTAASIPSPTDAFTEIRTKVLQRYGKIGLKSVGQLLRSMDTDHSGSLDAEELRSGLREGLGVCISDPDFARIVRSLDTNGDGRIDLREMIAGLRGPIPNRRRNVIEQAFRRLDVNNNGVIDVNELAASYDVSRHPDVLARRATNVQVAEKFLSEWDNQPDSLVTAEEFINYYVGVSETVPQDDQFELLLIRSWALDRPSNASSALAANRSSASGQDGVSSRYNANHGVPPPPKGNSPNGTVSSSGTNTIGYITEDGAIARREHPLYQTAMMEYGKTAGQHRHEPHHHLPGGFTKNAPPFSAGSGLNTSVTRSKVI